MKRRGIDAQKLARAARAVKHSMFRGAQNLLQYEAPPPETLDIDDWIPDAVVGIPQHDEM